MTAATRMSLASLLGSLLHRLPRTPPKTNCWVCNAVVGTHYPQDIHQSPLGGAFSFSGCKSCQDRRAATPMHAAHWFVSMGEDPAEGLTPHAVQMVDLVDGDGERSGRPIHVHLAGAYVPLVPWATSPKGNAAREEARGLSRLIQRETWLTEDDGRRSLR